MLCRPSSAGGQRNVGCARAAPAGAEQARRGALKGGKDLPLLGRAPESPPTGRSSLTTSASSSSACSSVMFISARAQPLSCCDDCQLLRAAPERYWPLQGHTSPSLLDSTWCAGHC